MNNKYLITTYTQLKTISDPLRVQIIILLIEKEMTVTEIGKTIQLPKAKAFYHLKELEKQGMIRITRTQEVKGNIHKYYRATHNGFEIDEQLLPQLKEDIGTVHSSIIIQQLENTKKAVSENVHLLKEKNSISQTRQVNCTEEQFTLWTTKYDQLMTELDQMKEDENSKLFYITTVGIEIEHKIFE
ncbi:ArsR family transcriptional regulator [Carnobacterium sp.]|uniref:ArsR/SmtB family transcription factor n=1 Tax=Carnobacterium sp. TaxID=48221 RepID=UPI0028A95ACD|nr:ArsR family transcriptional regulator [Carnobacterium sp.]